MTHSPQNNTSPENLAIVLRFRMGNFEEGFPVTVEIKKNHETVENFDFRRIPAAPKLAERQHRWAELYKELRGRGISSVKEQITHESTMDKYVLADNALKAGVEEWLNHKDFELLKHHICNLARKAARVDQCKSVPVIIEIDSSNTEDDINLLRRIPWNCWSLFKELPNAEAVLSLQRSSQHDAQVKVLRHPVRILAIFGSSEGNLQFSDEEKVLERLEQRGAEITCLKQPRDDELHNSLWEHSWDILFFAGHSYSEPNLKSGYLKIRDGESKSLESLRNDLGRAVNQGLKLAIFNSCDGLGIANYLADIGVPTMIVMREPVPDRVARKFLEYLLDILSTAKPLYLAFREARDRLQWLENDNHYLAATRLPVICQGPSQLEVVWPSPPTAIPIATTAPPPTATPTATTAPPPPSSWRQLLRRLCRLKWVVLAALVALTIIAFPRFREILPTPPKSPSPQPSPSPVEPNPLKNQKISFGEDLLIPNKLLPEKRDAINAIESKENISPTSEKKVVTALTNLKKYLHRYKNDPEAWIYLNNVIAITTQQLYPNTSLQTIAVIVPENQENENKWAAAEEILRGVAQEQSQFNCGIDNLKTWVDNNQSSLPRCKGTNGKFLKVAIAIYHDLDSAKDVTQAIVNNPDKFGGVVARYPSDILEKVAPFYETGRQVVIVPASNAVRSQPNDGRKEAIKLNEYIFRMIPDTSYTAEYLRQKLGDENLAVVYEHDNPYTESLREEIQLKFGELNAVVLKGEECNLKRNSNFNPDNCINKLQEKGISNVFIAPSLENLDNALDLINNIAIKNQEGQRPKPTLLGSDTMYDEKLLGSFGKAADNTDLEITVPWARSPKESPTAFEQGANDLFGTPFINWRTAASYDATQVILKGLAQNPSPSQEDLSVTLSRSGFRLENDDPQFKTATGSIEFLNGDRVPSAHLQRYVKVVKDKESPQGYNFQ